MGNNLWIDKEREGCGYGAVKIYECEDFYVSTGSLNSFVDREKFADNQNVILFCFKKFDITLIGGNQQLREWHGLRDWDRGLTNEIEGLIRKHVFKLLLSHLDYHWFSWLLDDAYNKGLKSGRNGLRSELRQLMREEF